MVKAFRISDKKYQSSIFTGEGGLRAAGRWNRKGRRIIHASASVSLAILESLVNNRLMDPFSKFVAGELEFDASLIEVLDIAKLPRTWRDEEYNDRLWSFSDDWLRRGQFAVLQVPSAVVPQEKNYLIDVEHEDFGRITQGRVYSLDLDTRLAGTSKPH